MNLINEPHTMNLFTFPLKLDGALILDVSAGSEPGFNRHFRG